MPLPSPSGPAAARGVSGKAFRTATALAAVSIATMAASLAAEPSIGGLFAAALVPVLVAIAVIDARHFIIPDALNALGLLLGLSSAAATAPDALDGLLFALARGMALAVVFLSIRLAYGGLRGREGLGLGDVKLAAVAGVWLDVATMPLAVAAAALAGLLVYGLRRLLSGRAIRAGGRLPFGLFFAPAIWIGWMLDRWAAGLT